MDRADLKKWLLDREIFIICGHYGTGKTNLAINLALTMAEMGESVTIADMDIVNPYFRTADYSRMLGTCGIQAIAPNFASTNVDTPSLVPAFDALFDQKLRGGRRVIIDVGGDDAGATVLGRYADKALAAGAELLFVINRYRALIAEPSEAVELLRDVEACSGLKVTGIVNNSHLKELTDGAVVAGSLPYAEAVARQCGLPLLFSTAPEKVLDDGLEGDFFPVKTIVGSPWDFTGE